MDAAKHDDLGVLDLTSLARELERVADKIRDLENFRPLIVVREDDRLALALELEDARDSVGMALARRHIIGVFLMQRGQLGMQARCADGRSKCCLDCGSHYTTLLCVELTLTIAVNV